MNISSVLSNLLPVKGYTAHDIFIDEIWVYWPNTKKGNLKLKFWLKKTTFLWYHITGDLLHWLDDHDYVSDIKQKVFENNECSNPNTDCQSGHSPILGPLLFVLYCT